MSMLKGTDPPLHYPVIPTRGRPSPSPPTQSKPKHNNATPPPHPRPPLEFTYNSSTTASSSATIDRQNVKPRKSSEAGNALVPHQQHHHPREAPSNFSTSKSSTKSSSSSTTLFSLLLPKWRNTNKSTPTKSVPCSKWSCFQVGEFLDACGLGQYSASFQQQGVDGEILLELNPEQIERCMGMRNRMHMISLVSGVQLLCDGKVKTVETWEWSCARTADWLCTKGLDSLAPKFVQLAVHGGVLFRLRQDEFEQEMQVDNALVLMSLMTAIERAREVGICPHDAVLDVPDWTLKRVRTWLERLCLAHLFHVFQRFSVHGALLLHLDRDMMMEEMHLTEIQAMVLEKAISKLKIQMRNSKRWFRGSGVSLLLKPATAKENEIPLAVPYRTGTSEE